MLVVACRFLGITKAGGTEHRAQQTAARHFLYVVLRSNICVFCLPRRAAAAAALGAVAIAASAAVTSARSSADARRAVSPAFAVYQ